MIRRIIQIDEENVTDVERVQQPATKARLVWWMVKRNFCVTITAMDWETACRHARQELLLLWREKRQLMMRRQ